MAKKTNPLTLYINVVSAKNLTDVDQRKLYVAVLFTGAAQTEQRATSHVDRDGGRNPTWNFPVKFAVHVDGVKQDVMTRVVFALKCENNGKELGEVHVSVAELMQVSGDGKFMQYVAVSYPVKKPSGHTVGMLNFEFKFGGSPTSDTPAAGSATRNVGGYPPQGYYYPPPPPAAGYGGYPPSPYPYTPYPPPSPSHYMPSPPQYPPYNGGYYAAPPYGYPPHASHVPPPVGTKQRSIKDKGKNKSWKMGTKILGSVGALALGAITGGSVPDLSGFTSGFQMPDTSAFAPPDFSTFYPLPDPSTLPTNLPDFSSLYPLPDPSTRLGNSYC